MTTPDSNPNQKSARSLSPSHNNRNQEDSTTLIDPAGEDSFTQSIKSIAGPSYEKLAEELKKAHSFDSKAILNLIRSSNTLEPELVNKLEEVLPGQNEKITENTLNQTILLMKQYTKKEKEPGIDQQGQDDALMSDSDSDAASLPPVFERGESRNLIEAVKENIELMLNSSNLKRKSTKKRWWTTEEVQIRLLLLLMVLNRTSY